MLNYQAKPKYLADTKRRRVATSDSLWRHGKSVLHHHNDDISAKYIFQHGWMSSDEKFTGRPSSITSQHVHNIPRTALIPTVHIKTIIMFAFSLKKIFLILNPSLTTLIGILIMSTLAMIILTVKLRSVTIVVLNLYDCLANVRKIKCGLHLGLSVV